MSQATLFQHQHRPNSINLFSLNSSDNSSVSKFSSAAAGFGIQEEDMSQTAPFQHQHSPLGQPQPFLGAPGEDMVPQQQQQQQSWWHQGGDSMSLFGDSLNSSGTAFSSTATGQGMQAEDVSLASLFQHQHSPSVQPESILGAWEGELLLPQAQQEIQQQARQQAQQQALQQEAHNWEDLTLQETQQQEAQQEARQQAQQHEAQEWGALALQDTAAGAGAGTAV